MRQPRRPLRSRFEAEVDLAVAVCGVRGASGLSVADFEPPEWTAAETPHGTAKPSCSTSQPVRSSSKPSLSSGAPQSVLVLRMFVPGAATSTVVAP